MTALRRLSYLALFVAFGHVVFGAIVRITGSGMGCGDHWPKCYGQWFPPLDRPDLIIEWTHRLLAALLVAVVAVLVVVAFRRRRTDGGRVLRAASLALALVVSAALLGAVTVWLGNTTLATVAHKMLALGLVATLAAAVVRAGGLGGGGVATGDVPRSTVRSATAAAVLALLVVGMGALTAKYPGASTACHHFPLCGETRSADAASVHVHMTHRILAFLLAFHVLGMASSVARRVRSAAVVRTTYTALGLVVAQIAIAAAMVLHLFPASLRSLHQAVGVAVWITLFLLAYLARRGAAASAEVASGERYAAEPRVRGAET